MEVRTPSSLKLAGYSVCACARAFPRASLVPVVPFLVATHPREGRHALWVIQLGVAIHVAVFQPPPIY
ncbi:hypothetical protein D9757_001615 [Collybiopsis confluens]|uniref:Uncharacterized protein n=1 Tax=Collybiopsis confluens TaxID=2823264 RepID=A0A8H5HYR6_9AGAR|nr:hypothetical protein D9757_001615 [Collybiopsis confluens]